MVAEHFQVTEAVSRGDEATADVLVVGAGQAGLAATRALLERRLSVTLHERHPRIGDSWRTRFDSLVLFTPRAISALPGLAHAGDPRGYPGKDEMGDYLERYAERFRLPVVSGDGITRLSRVAGMFMAESQKGRRIRCRAVVIATGGFQRARIPPFVASIAGRVPVLDALTYRNPAALSARRVVVVGDGATGRQIARELVQSREVILATGRYRFFGPQRLFGADTTALALRAGLLTADKSTTVARVMRSLDPTPGLHLRFSALRRANIVLAPRCVGAEDDQVTFADGSRRRCDAVVCTAGYHDDTGWVDIDGAISSERFVENSGVASVPGLYYVGREWQTSRASGLVCGVHSDARVIAGHVVGHLNGNDRHAA